MLTSLAVGSNFPTYQPGSQLPHCRALAWKTEKPLSSMAGMLLLSSLRDPLSPEDILLKMFTDEKHPRERLLWLFSILPQSLSQVSTVSPSVLSSSMTCRPMVSHSVCAQDTNNCLKVLMNQMQCPLLKLDIYVCLETHITTKNLFYLQDWNMRKE